MKRQPPRTDVRDSIKDFDNLPNLAYVRQPVVQLLLGCSSATIWRMVASGRIPKPVKISTQVTGWNVGELRAALAPKALLALGEPACPYKHKPRKQPTKEAA